MDSAARPSSTSSADTSVPEEPDDSKSREGTPSSDAGGYLPGSSSVAPVELTGSATGAGVAPGANWRVGYEHPLTAATSAMLNIQNSVDEQQHHQQHQVVLYEDYDFRSGSVVPAAHGSIIPHLNKISDDPQHLSSNSELGLLLTSEAGTSLVKREAEDLTASRRSPGLTEGRRLTVSTVVGLDERVGSPGSGGGRGFPTSQQPVAVLHPEDSPSPKDMSSAAHYTAQYTGLAPAQVFPDVVATQYSVMPHSPTSSINYTSVSLGGPTSQPLRLAANGASLVASAGGGGVYATVDPYYRDYYSPPVEQYTTTAIGSTARPTPVYGDSQEPQHGQFVERYIRTSTAPGGYKLPGQGLTVDLPSPDSGIGAEATTPRDQNPAALQQTPAHGYEYTDLCGQGALIPTDPSLLRPQSTTPNSVTRSRPWHDFGRQTEVDKIHIPKIYSNYGFRFFMESPISTSQRREDDRMTYVNKGQFYGVTMEYVPDPDRPLKSGTVKSVVLLLFREEKVLEDEMKAWQFWHSRQHSVKQRILDVDTKNSIGLVGGIDEISHNAIAVYWNPLESSAKISIAVQCLSTDFSSQKGVKGLPLHIQIDTYEDYRDPNCPVSHRAYVQIKSFCDKGAERKTRDEERRASKRKMTVTGRKKMEEMYHPASERSELYSMADTTKPPMLFQPSDEEPEKQLGTMELQNYYGHTDNDHQMCADPAHSPVPSQMASPGETAPPDSGLPAAPLKFHYSFPTAAVPGVDPTALEGGKDGDLLYSAAKRARLSPPANQRVMLYVRQEQEELYTPLHVVPPTTMGLLHAISNKYKITSSCVQTLCRKNRKGVTAIVDDDMIQHYCNEDTFLLEIRQLEPDGPYDITLIEVGD